MVTVDKPKPRRARSAKPTPAEMCTAEWFPPEVVRGLAPTESLRAGRPRPRAL